MNLYSVIGLIISVIFFYTGLRMSTDNLLMFWDPHGFVIVAGGTFAATIICFQLDRMWVIFKIFIRRLIFGKKHEIPHLIEEIVKVAELYVKGESLASVKASIKDPFFREAIGIMEDGVIQRDEMIEIMEKRNANLTFHYMQEAKKVKIIGKFPPSFGVMATVIGMTVLFGQLGGADAMQKMGPAMAVCLCGTLYGVAFSNLIFIPMGENLMEDTEEMYHKNQVVVEGMRLITAKQNSILIIEKLNSFLTPGERLDWKKVLKK